MTTSLDLKLSPPELFLTLNKPCTLQLPCKIVSNKHELSGEKYPQIKTKLVQVYRDCLAFLEQFSSSEGEQEALHARPCTLKFPDSSNLSARHLNIRAPTRAEVRASAQTIRRRLSWPPAERCINWQRHVWKCWFRFATV